MKDCCQWSSGSPVPDPVACCHEYQRRWNEASRKKKPHVTSNPEENQIVIACPIRAEIQFRFRILMACCHGGDNFPVAVPGDTLSRR